MIFDPTVFDNLKVAFENELYDLDNLDERIVITDRKDTMELSVMGREFSLKFHLANFAEVSAEVRLAASLRDLAAEILGEPGSEPGCSLTIFYYMTVVDEQRQCKEAEELLKDIWEPAASPKQTLSHLFDQTHTGWSNKIELCFNRRINEEQMNDIPELVQHMLESLEKLATLHQPD